MSEEQENFQCVYNSVKGKEKKTRDEAENRGKDQMMKITRIHDKELGFYPKYPAKSMRQG